MEHHNQSSGRGSIRFEGTTWPVLESRCVGRRRYLILERLGQAGRECYRVFDPAAGPRGAMRRMLVLASCPASRQRLSVLQRLSRSSENLPGMLDCKRDGSHTVLVLDWVHGMDLKQYLELVREGTATRPSPVEAVRLARGLAHGLSILHRRLQVIHGDIQPGNLILTSRPSRLIPVDFGSAWLSQRTGQRDPGDGSVPAYTAPELQREPFTGDFRSDQFSLSVVFYELLTLQVPWNGLGGVAAQSRTPIPLTPPSRGHPDRTRLARSIWQLIDQLLTDGLTLDPEGRLPTSRAWLDAFDALNAHIRSQQFPETRLSLLTQVICCVGNLLSIQSTRNSEKPNG